MQARSSVRPAFQKLVYTKLIEGVSEYIYSEVRVNQTLVDEAARTVAVLIYPTLSQTRYGFAFQT